MSMDYASFINSGGPIKEPQKFGELKKDDQFVTFLARKVSNNFNNFKERKSVDDIARAVLSEVNYDASFAGKVIAKMDKLKLGPHDQLKKVEGVIHQGELLKPSDFYDKKTLTTAGRDSPTSSIVAKSSLILGTLQDPDSLLEFVASHAEEMKSDPTLATKAHHMLHELAQNEIANGNVVAAFKIASQAAIAIPLSDTHPLHEMDQAILQGASKQFDVKTGAYFSSFDTSIVKGGNLHATQRVIDGKLTNTFDFKISHYARDELEMYLNAIVDNPKEYEASLPEGFCTGVEINEGVPQQYLRCDNELRNEFTTNEAFCPLGATATEIVFKGVGKVIIGTKKEVGCMYNWIQVAMEANLPPGEGAKKLHHMLSVAGCGPVIGLKTTDSDERMKIAQLFRAFYPSRATAFDTTKEFYQLSPKELRKEIEKREPGMGRVFTKYLDDSPHLMKKVEILPGKEIWGIVDLGKEMKAKGAYGLMTGVGNSGGWDSAKDAIKRILTQGAMSSEQRFQAGIFKKGVSSIEDLCSGGGDQIFTRIVNDKTSKEPIKYWIPSGNAQILWDLDSVAQRVPYGYDEDKYGVKNRFQQEKKDRSYSYNDYQNRLSMMELASKVSNADNEVMVKNSLSPQHVIGVVVKNDSRKEELIRYLVKEGLAEKNSSSGAYVIKFAGKQIEANSFIHVNKKFTKEMWVS